MVVAFALASVTKSGRKEEKKENERNKNKGLIQALGSLSLTFPLCQMWYYQPLCRAIVRAQGGIAEVSAECSLHPRSRQHLCYPHSYCWAHIPGHLAS